MIKMQRNILSAIVDSQKRIKIKTKNLIQAGRVRDQLVNLAREQGIEESSIQKALES